MNYIKNSSLILILMYIFQAPALLSTFTSRNLGFDFSIIIPFLFLLLPSILILGESLLEGSIKLPNFYITFSALILFLLLESKWLEGTP